MKDVHGYGSNPIHGYSGGTPEYCSWQNMMARCYNQKKDAFPWYGGSGISVCLRWHDFQNFLEDMGKRPKGATLSRKDNKGNYEPGNCEWETSWKKQMQNRRNTVWVKYKGKRMTLTDFAEEIGIAKSALHQRHRQGWSASKIVNHYSDRSNWSKPKRR